jgi:hypothetical protein
MEGYMAAMYENNGRDVVESYLLSIVKDEMDENKILVGDILETAYIGRRSSSALENVSDSSNSSVGMAASVTIPLIFILLVGMLLFALRKRHQKRERAHSKDAARVATDLDNFHSESGSHESRNVPVAATTTDEESVEVLATVSKSGVATVNSDETDNAVVPDDYDDNSDIAVRDIASDDATEVAGNLDETRVIAPLSTARKQKMTRDERETVQSAAEKAATLAGLPSDAISASSPSRKGRSQTLKPQRKKKKVKKKKQLMRTNSREQIQGMEAITEGEEEEVHSDSDDSDYSWVTDDTGSRNGSREPSPNPSSRDTSSTGSREPSPSPTSHGRDISPANSRTSQGDDPILPPRPDSKKTPPLPPPMWV